MSLEWDVARKYLSCPQSLLIAPCAHIMLRTSNICSCQSTTFIPFFFEKWVKCCPLIRNQNVWPIFPSPLRWTFILYLIPKRFLRTCHFKGLQKMPNKYAFVRGYYNIYRAHANRWRGTKKRERKYMAWCECSTNRDGCCSHCLLFFLIGIFFLRRFIDESHYCNWLRGRKRSRRSLLIDLLYGRRVLILSKGAQSLLGGPQRS